MAGISSFVVPALTSSVTVVAPAQLHTRSFAVPIVSASTIIVQNIFTTQTPTGLNNNDGQALTVATRFTALMDGQATGIRFYRATTAPTSAIGLLYSEAGAELARVTFTMPGTTGWNTAAFASPVAITSGATYRAAYYSNGPYADAPGQFPTSNDRLSADAGFYAYSGANPAFPTSQFNNGCYFADIVFSHLPVVYSIPGPPTGLVAAAGSNAATISFAIPINVGGGVTNYTLTSSPGGVTATGTASPITVSGLTNGTAYTFTGKANNPAGSSVASTASNSVTPSLSAAVPNAPGRSVAVEGNTNAYITWPTPTSNGGSAITGYVVTPYIGASPGTPLTVGVVNAATVTGLTNATAYTFKVVGLNANGTGAQSAATNAVTPLSLPTGVSLRAVDGGPDFYSQWSYTASVDNASFFPIAVYLASVQSAADVTLDKTFNLNTYIGLTANSNASYVAAGGMQFWPQRNEWFSQQSSAITAWNLDDEVDMFDGPGYGAGQGFTIMAADAAQVAGNGRMTTANYGKGVIFWEDDGSASIFVDVFQDHVSVDVYWISDQDSGFGSQGGKLLNGDVLTDLAANQRKKPSNYGVLIDRMRALMVPGRLKPCTCFIEVGGPGSGQPASDVYISPAQIRAAVWAVLIHGARAVYYFNHTFGTVFATDNCLRDTTDYGPQGAMVTSVNAQVLTLAPVLNSPTALSYATHTGNVDVMAKKATRGNGKFYVFAISTALTDAGSQSITFTLAGETNATITVEGESRTLSMSGGQFTDTFADSQAVHIYRVG
jgi:hypothetical protein